MGNIRASLSQSSGHSLEHVPHSCFPVQHRPSFLIRSNIVLNFLFHFIVGPLKINDLKQNIIDFLTE